MISFLLARLRRPFYGWWIVAGALVGQFTWMGVGPAVVGVFLLPVVNDLGWQVWQFTLGTTLAAAGGALSGIVAGEAVDRYGPRPLMLLGAAVTTVCFVGLSLQSNLWIFLALYAITGFAGWTLFGPLVVNAAVSKWFITKRGWALAVGSIGVSLAGMISPVTVTFIVDTWNWRSGYAALGTFITLAIVPAAFVMRRMPEDYGMRPDGDGAGTGPQAAQTPSAVEPHSLTRSQALRTSGFWLLTLGFTLNYTAMSAILVHAIPFATEAGFSRAVASAALAVNGVGNLASKGFWGYGLQRFDARLLAATAYTVSATGVALMILAGVTGQGAILFPRLLPVRLRFRRNHPAQRVPVGSLLRTRAHRRDPRHWQPHLRSRHRLGAGAGRSLVRPVRGLLPRVHRRHRRLCVCRSHGRRVKIQAIAGSVLIHDPGYQPPSS